MVNTQQEIVSKLQSRFKSAVTEVQMEGLEPYVRIAPESWLDVALFLRNDCDMNMLQCLTSVDRGKGKGLEAIYHVERMAEKRVGIAIRIAVSAESPVIPSVCSVWRTADWHEREAFDLMGLHFTGHPNLVRILCAEDWEGHPLRKDYKSPDTYHGIKNNVV